MSNTFFQKSEEFCGGEKPPRLRACARPIQIREPGPRALLGRYPVGEPAPITFR